MSWTRSLLIIISAIFVSLLSAEILLRVFWDNPFKDIRSSKIIEMKMQPANLDTKKNRQWLDKKQPHILFRTNRDSFIEPSHQHTNPFKTIMFMGGSTTECSYVREELRFPNYISTLFSKANIKINTINVGRSGNTLHDTINLFLNEMNKHKPDYVVMMHAANDKGVLEKDPQYLTRMAQEVSKTHMLKWILQSASSQSSIFGLIRESIMNYYNNKYLTRKSNFLEDQKVGNIDFLPFKQRLFIFINVVRSLGIEPILMTQPMSPSIKTKITPKWINMTDQEELNMIIRNVALEENVLLVDLSRNLALIPEYQKNPNHYLYDGIHVTDRGSIEYANIFFKKFSFFLKKSVEKK